jgi:hypothetical protein
LGQKVAVELEVVDVGSVGSATPQCGVTTSRSGKLVFASVDQQNSGSHGLFYRPRGPISGKIQRLSPGLLEFDLELVYVSVLFRD